jgi:Ca-activated chloride channel family protein
VAATLGIKIYTIGAVGSAPLQRGGLNLFARGRAQVDEGMLKGIARTTGGKYFRATDTDSLVTVYDEIDRLERRRTGERTYQDNVYASRFAMFVGLALLFAELLLTQTLFRRVP